MVSCPFSSSNAPETEYSALGQLFSQIPRERLIEIADGMRHATLAEGEVLVHEGTKPEDVYLLVEGRLGVYARDGSDRLTRICAISELGSLVGEQNVREERRFASATVIALTDCRVAAISSRVFKALLADDSTAVAKLEEEGRRQVFEKLRRLHEEVADMILPVTIIITRIRTGD
jgi:CRP-like cAMP-binding protein